MPRYFSDCSASLFQYQSLRPIKISQELSFTSQPLLRLQSAHAIYRHNKMLVFSGTAHKTAQLTVILGNPRRRSGSRGKGKRNSTKTSVCWEEQRGRGDRLFKKWQKNGRKENKSVNSINLRARKTRRECINSRLETEVTFYLNPNHHVLR